MKCTSTFSVRLQQNLLFKIFHNFLVLMVVTVSSLSFAQTVVVPLNKPGAGTFEIPACVSQFTVEIWGAGGGGGYRNIKTNASGSAGGGGGAYAKIDVSVIGNRTYDYEIGKGGSGSEGKNKNDTKNGTETWFTLGSTGSPDNRRLRAGGGIGVANNNVQNQGSGGSTYNAPSTGGGIVSTFVTYKGGKGSRARNRYSGGGGAAAGPLGPGGDSDNTTTNVEALDPGLENNGGIYSGDVGRGGHGVMIGTAGSAGLTYGGGGAGSFTNYSILPSGGAGADGGIVITYTFPKIEPTISSNIFCAGSPVNIQHATAGVSAITTTGLPNGVTATYAVNMVTISGTPASGQTGVFNYVITPNNCATYKLEGTFTINTSSVGGTVNSAQMICIGTAPASLTLSGQNGNVVRWEKANNSGFTGAVNVNYTSTTLTSSIIGPLTANTYFRAVVQNGVCGTIPSEPVLIRVGPGTETKFTGGTSWSNGVPDLNKKAIFAADYDTANGNITACNCEIQPDVKLEVGKDSNVTIQNNIVNNGNIIVKSDGNLIQINNNGTFTGNDVTVERNSKMKRLDYIYWGTPVTGQTLRTFSINTVASRFYTYNEVDDSFKTITDLNQPMLKGEGYVIRAPNNFTTLATWPAVFRGKPNNGIVQVQVTKGGLGKNLVGNPYPSNLDLDKLTVNNSILSTGTYYFWTNVNDWDKTNGTTPNGQFGNYTANNYSIYNGSGGTPAANSSKFPSGIVKPGQGFLYEAEFGGYLMFSNVMRTSTTIDKWGQTSVFVSNKGGLDEREGPKAERYWLKLTNPAGNFNTLLIAYVEGATNNFESKFDAKFPVQSSDRFYSISDNSNLIVQGRQFPFVADDNVTLGIHNFETGIYNISLSKKEGIFIDGQAIYLKDKQTGTITNLSQASYNFTADEGVSDTRFEIIYKPETVLVTDSTLKEGVIVYRDGDGFVIKSPKTIAIVEVYDLAGRIITVLKPNSKKAVMMASRISNGIYVLKITTTDGQIVNKKISR